MATKLTLKQERFIASFLRSGNASAAYRDAYDCSKMKEATIGNAAHKLLAHTEIKAKVENYRKTAAADVLMEARDVLRNWVTIVTADRRELITHRRCCCRHCWGTSHKYQWIDEPEFMSELMRTIDWNAGATTKNKRVEKPLPDASGGVGFKRNRKPHPECPKCNGEGYSETFVPDFSDLSPAAQLLYAGIKQTKEGIEVKMMDKDSALTNLAKALGVLKDGVVINNGPTINGDVVPVDANEAAKFYRDFMGKNK